jgi:threonine synthase
VPLTRLECARCDKAWEPGQRRQTCECGAPLLARYDLERAAKEMRPGHLALRPPTLWRYREVLPVADPDDCVSLGEGFTPLLQAPRLSDRLGLPRVLMKDEAVNPAGSVEARGCSVAVSMAVSLRARGVAAASAGSGGLALAVYATRAGLPGHVFFPARVDRPFADGAGACGAHVESVDGLLPDAERLCGGLARQNEWLDCTAFQEPFRLEGAKTLGYEIAEQMGWSLPDAVVCATGSGLALLGLWKALEELEAMGFVGPGRPRLYAVQPEGCAPLVRAFEFGAAEAVPWDEPRTRFGDLEVPRTPADFLVLRVLHDSHGAAVPVTDDEILRGLQDAASGEGLLLSPAGGAAVAALRRLKATGHLSAHDTVVVVNAASGLPSAGQPLPPR